MSPLLKDYLNKKIVIITVEGSCYLAMLEGYDKYTNLIVSDVRNRFDDKLISQFQMLRGSEIVTCGLIEEETKETDEKEEFNKEATKDEQDVVIPKLKDTRNRVANEHLIWQKVYEKKGLS
ncbi:U4/U6-U5 snRNP complex subunit LSM8 NDAI_0C03080 [Naumovozyma dairenensis CBS 421]|uniref:LSM2-LSM8 complex subunit LSM8 n=1 Tax=Naumovozyma dairenensis (strain ATCC 10597 / BCRC 20456 / CBS 421 / NBRC 0211 / NRRL Y-12639) TaxID=1071378 RepID=G0W857_NAUDC|nr:hypothetical protein NDAI_0C03080 [Naumovozyma dairenensis CBS 421]CCD23968.1 hypothetical protein NDAI_0C03080 [Naumovozyma dairenensis CBS 421]